MNALFTELKTRARLRLNSLRREVEAASANCRLRDCLNQVARDVGFLNWQQALRVLSGRAAQCDDMGSFWHAPRCNSLLSHWFASYERAREALAISEQGVLVPYGRQFIVVDGNYLRELGLAVDEDAWRRAGRDLVRAYGSEAWLALSEQRLRATRNAAPG